MKIDIVNVSKIYGTKAAVDDVNLSLDGAAWTCPALVESV